MLREDPNERLAFFRPAALPGTEVMAVYGSMQPWHMFHERYAFCACSAGAAGVRYRGRKDLVHGGSVLVRAARSGRIEVPKTRQRLIHVNNPPVLTHLF